MFVVCPECLAPGCIRLVSRSQLEFLAADSGLQLAPWPASSAHRYWWCSRCQNGGAFYRWQPSERTDPAPARTARQRRALRRGARSPYAPE